MHPYLFCVIFQACMEAEIAAEQGRKREAALHAALQAEKRFVCVCVCIRLSCR
jgi:hypothetical protein